jgi:hypothetical protein
MTDTIAPTKERLRRDQWDQPCVDQSTNRTAFRAKSKLRQLWDKGEIEADHYQAGLKFERHYLGSLGIDVRTGDDSGISDGRHKDEIPQVRHGSELAAAKSILTPREFQILSKLISEEATPLTIGFGLSGYTDRRQQLSYGISAIYSALDRLSYHWGMKR